MVNSTNENVHRAVLEADLTLTMDEIERKLTKLVNYIEEHQLQNSQKVLDFFDKLNEMSVKY